jgi:hypothetical protein
MRWRTVTKEQDYRLVGGALVGTAVAYFGYRLGVSRWEVVPVWFVTTAGIHIAAGNKLSQW